MKSFLKVDKHGNKEWRTPNGKLHNKKGPAVILVDGTMEYWRKGKRHRKNGRVNHFSWNNGPAIIRADGSEEYWRKGKLNNKKGPAIIRADGTMEYWRKGKRCDHNGSIIKP